MDALLFLWFISVKSCGTIKWLNFCQVATSLISLSHVDLLVCDEWNHLLCAWFVLCVSAELLTVMFLEQISIKRFCSVYTNLLFWLQKFSSSSDTRSRQSLFARWNANWGRRKSTSKARAAAGTASTAHSIRYKWKKIECKITLCLFEIFPLVRSVMVMNFRARGATECLRAAVENDCALGLRKHNPECAFHFIVWKNSPVTDLFE